MGTSVTKVQLEKLATVTDRAVILFDGDEAGVRAAARASEIAAGVGISTRVALLPDEIDPAQAALTRSDDLASAIDLAPVTLAA